MSRAIFYSVCTCLIMGSCSTDSETLFDFMPVAKTGIDFSNRIQDNDSFNILTYEYIYNGGGVALADFNQDSLVDVFFTGNMVSNDLYLNQGDFEFEDVSEQANIEARDFWCSGIAVTDINYDGLPDIYISTNTHRDPAMRRNLLFEHQGVDGDGVPTFREAASEYGIADTSYAMNSIFFDYDNDQDLDLLIITNHMQGRQSPARYQAKDRIDFRRVDRLYRNDWSEELNHPIFTNVSAEAGITVPGYSLGVNVMDINADGWQDIYITNDFISNDVLYINQGDGTFLDQANLYLKHTSHSAMGNDIADLNNDGQYDIVALDMLPEDNYRRKTMMGPTNYMTYINNRKFGYDYQYVRNTLQLGQGHEPENGRPLYADVAFYAGIAATDWSWSPLIADFDLDRDKDLIVTNGFPKDITDRDFIDYQVEVQNIASDELLLTRIPEVKINNYAFRNEGEVRFEQVTSDWGMDRPSFSNGAAYGDLDNDGDLDVVINNINDSAYIYRNESISKDLNARYLRVKLHGPPKNQWGIGASVYVYCGGEMQLMTMRTSRGYLSSHEPYLHFGIGDVDHIDSLTVSWPDGKRQTLSSIQPNQSLVLDHTQAVTFAETKSTTGKSLLKKINEKLQLDFVHEEFDYIDYNVQPLLPHKLSQYGPGITTGDVNGDGLMDMYIGGSADKPGSLKLQNKGGTFDDLPFAQSLAENYHEETGVLFFDADNDGDDDLYIVSGGYEFALEDSFYLDRFYRNENGSLILQDVIPALQHSGSCVRAADFDRDGDLDLMVGGRVWPHKYPSAVSTLLLENKLEEGSLRYALANDEKAPALNNIGMVSDLIWTDVDRDGWLDVLLVGEWMSIRYLHNEKGKLVEATASAGLESHVGWWNSISGADVDLDGDIDYVCGNFGDNLIFDVTNETPITALYGDLDENGGFDMIFSVYLDDEKGAPRQTTMQVRNDVIKQLNGMRSHFLTNHAYATVGLDQILAGSLMERAEKLEANYLKTSWLENDGNGQFTIHALPWQFQLAPVYSTMPIDLNDDLLPDLIASGNDYGMEITMGRCDALSGLVALGPLDDPSLLNPRESGYVVPGDAKGMSTTWVGEELVLLSAQNQGPLLAHSIEVLKGRSIEFSPLDNYVSYKIAGKLVRQEANMHQSFLSNSLSSVLIPHEAEEVTIVNSQGEGRSVDQ